MKVFLLRWEFNFRRDHSTTLQTIPFYYSSQITVFYTFHHQWELSKQLASLSSKEHLPEKTTVEDGGGENPFGQSEPHKRAAERANTFPKE
jgi:hypothetical protein